MASSKTSTVIPPVAALLLLLAFAPGCRRHNVQQLGPAGATFATAVAGGEWSLLELNDRPVPGGAGGKRPTIGFNAAAARAVGFTGCNQYAVAFAVHHDTLRFQAPDMTHTACTVGVDLERQFLSVLIHTERYRIADGDLLFLRDTTTLARFTRGGN